MKVSIAIGGAASGRQRDIDVQVETVLEAEKLGVDGVWSAEAWGEDAVVPLAYLAARTDRIKLGTGIMQISARAPSMTAMTALTLAAYSKNRFMLGLGVSGPQVVEGLQGRPFKAPLSRMRETVDILRLAFAGERLAYDGAHHRLPLPGGEGKALRLAQPGNENIPIYLAVLSPRTLRYAGLEHRLRRSVPMRTWPICAKVPNRRADLSPTSISRLAARSRSATISTPWWNRSRLAWRSRWVPWVSPDELLQRCIRSGRLGGSGGRSTVALDFGKTRCGGRQGS